MERIAKNGKLSERHLLILRTIGELQPCGATSVARRLDISEKMVYRHIYCTLSRRGLIESKVVRGPWDMPRRKSGTLRLTPEGEKALSRDG